MTLEHSLRVDCIVTPEMKAARVTFLFTAITRDYKHFILVCWVDSVQQPFIDSKQLQLKLLLISFRTEKLQ